MPRLPRDQFEALVRDHHDVVYRAAWRVVGDAATGADVAQDVFVRVLAGKVHLDKAESVRATLCWLATMLANNAVRARRRRSRHEESVMREPSDERDDPAQVCAETDLQHAVRDVVDRLPGDLRVPLLLRCQDELSYASIGTALRVSESTAHERVQTALERLRAALTRRGLAVALAGLPRLVAEQPGLAPPLDLQPRLLALAEAMPAVAVAGTWRLVAAGLAAATVAVVAFVARPSAGTEQPPAVVAASSGGAAGAASDAAAGAAQEPLAAARTPVLPGSRVETSTTPLIQRDPAPSDVHVFTGTVHDAAAWPVAGASVLVFAAGGGKPHALGSTTTDAAGAFRLEFRASPLGGPLVRLSVVEAGQKLLETADLAVPATGAAEPLRLVLPPELGTATSRFVLAVRVHGSDGAALPGVPVVLYAAAEPRPRPLHASREIEAVTGADGVALLGGRTAGEKWLFVDGRGSGRAASFTAVTVARGGDQQLRVDLPPGRSLSGVVTTFDRSPIGWTNVWLEEDATHLEHPGELGPDGAIAFAGLGAGPCTLHVHSQTWSTVVERGLRPGSPPFAVTLKRRDDPRDLGNHLAELHGRLVDAVTGATVPFRPFAIEILRRRDGESTLLLDAAEPPLPAQQHESERLDEQFHEVGLTAGRWVLTARVPGYAVTAREFTLGERQILGNLTIALGRGAEVRGGCVDAAGKPVTGASVMVLGVGELADRCLEAWRARARARDRGEEDVGAADPSVSVGWGFTREQGAFVLTDVPPGVAVRLVAMRRGYPLAVLPPRVFQAGEKAAGLQLAFPAR